VGELGVGLAAVGDTRGDGFADLAVGEAATTAGAAGAVFLFHGEDAVDGITELTTSDAAWSWESGPVGAFFGLSIGAADVNGDGRNDLVVGAYTEDAGAADAGRVRVFFGDATDFADAPGITIGSGSPDAGSDGIGFAVASAIAFGGAANHDVDEDGIDDLLFGTIELGGAPGRGVLFYGDDALGASLTVQADADVLFPGLDANQFRSAIYAGDVNGDGWVDLLFSDRFYGGATGRAELRY
jgi:hypothetical protein